MTRRSALAAMVLGGVGFAAFGPRGAKEDARGRVVLDYWEKWTGHEAAAMKKIVDAFNQSQDRIVVRYLTTSGIDQKTLITIAAGDPPDVVGLWSYLVPVFAESDSLMPIDELDTKGEVRLERYAAGFHEQMTHRDSKGKTRQWATMNTGGTLAVYYNKAHFREVGLDPEKPPRTIEEFDAAHRKLVKRDADGSLTRAGFMHIEPGWWSWIWVFQFGGGVYDAANDRSIIGAPEAVAAYDWMQSYSKELGVDATKKFRAGFGNYDSPLNAFLTGRLSMVIQGPWLANVINAHGPKDANGKPLIDYGVMPAPVIPSLVDPRNPVGLVEGDVLVIPKGCKHPREAMEFIAFTQRQEHVEALSLAHYKSSTLAVSSEKFLNEHPNTGVRVFDAVAQSTQGFRYPRTQAWTQFKDELDGMAQRMWSIDKPAKEMLATVQARTQSYLDRAEEQRNLRGRSIRTATPPTGGGA